MLEVKKPKIQIPPNELPLRDTIITKTHEVTNYNEKGERITKRVSEKINITKLVNEAKKAIKRDKATELIKELSEIYTDKGVKK